MNARFTIDTISPVKRPGMSDDQLTREINAAKRLKAALTEMDLAIEEVNTLSECASVNTVAWDEFCHDEFPDLKIWDEKINAIRRCYA